jgi:hypothetical protein
MQTGSRPWRGSGGDHGASWSSPDSARIVARTLPGVARTLGPCRDRPDSIVTSGPSLPLEARPVTLLDPGLVGLTRRRPQPAGGLADRFYRSNRNLFHLDLDAGTVAIVGKGKSEKANVTLNAPTTAALADWVGARGEWAGPLFV